MKIAFAPIVTYFLLLFNSSAEANDPPSSSSLSPWQQMFNTLSIYCYALDSKNFTILEQVFTADAIAYFPAPLNTMNGVAAIEADLRWDLENVTTQHLLGSVSIDVIDERNAYSHSYFAATHFGTGNKTGEVAYHYGQYYDYWMNIGGLHGAEWLVYNRTLATMGILVGPSL